MNAKQKKTLAMVFEKPTRSATCRDGKGSRVRFEKGSSSIHIHKPHPARVLPKYSVDLIRDFLLEIGVES